jgi:Protein of unknown function (DUF3604)
MRSIARILTPLLLLALAAVPGCGEGEQDAAGAPVARGVSRPSGPPGALWDLVAELRADLVAERSPSDGGGRVWLEGEGETPLTLEAGSSHRFAFVYEAGPLGIAEGGALFMSVPPFWGWSPAQTVAPASPGYTEVSAEAEGVRLEVRTLDPPQLLGIRIGGRALAPGERIRITYGAGPAGAVVDRYAERGEHFRFAVDGDGDGVRGWMKEAPVVDLTAGPPGLLVLTLPSTARPGDTVDLVAAVLDASGSTGRAVAGPIEIRDAPAGLHLPGRIDLAPADRGRARVPVEVAEPGIYRIQAETVDGLRAESNPMVVFEDAPRLLWADLHGHSNYSDGTGLPEDYFRYARDVAALDVIALTDHDHWGMPFLDRSPERWAEIRDWANRFYEPGRFVTVLGYEWTNWIYGHRHVLYFDGEGQVLSSIDPEYETPTQLWDALRGRPVLTFAHHSAGGPIPTDWSFAPDPVLEPLTEVVSVHGSSEAADSPHPIYNAYPGNFVRDALDRGYRLGFVGSGDTHDGHPGLGHLVAPSGGLAAIWTEDRTREGVLAALRARRVYATAGPRILLFARLAGQEGGSEVPLPAGRSAELDVRVSAPEPLERIDVIRSGKVVHRIPCERERDVAVKWAADDLEPGEYLYIRVVQADRRAAWSSPWWITGSETPPPAP